MVGDAEEVAEEGALEGADEGPATGALGDGDGVGGGGTWAGDGVALVDEEEGCWCPSRSPKQGPRP